MTAPSRSTRRPAANGESDRLYSLILALGAAPGSSGRPVDGAHPVNPALVLRANLQTVYALCALLLAAVAVSALKISVLDFMPGLELLLFGWLGVALGRMTVAPADDAAVTADPEIAGRSDRIDAILHSIARLLQAQANESEAYSERLSGASLRLSQRAEASPVRDIVLALIEDNREMREKLATVRDQLEESRLQVLQLRNNLERTEEEGLRDPVTLIGNRRYFDVAFAEELERARTTGEAFCLALADLDHFKLVNDRFGHMVGDRILRLFAEILAQNLRGQDRLARFGGEEFALMLPGSSLEDATGAAERIRKILEAKRWTLGPTGEPVGAITASFGVAKLLASETGAELVKRTDELLYGAKAGGRNRVVSDATLSPAPQRRESRFASR
jgi:diguanylate cyclase